MLCLGPPLLFFLVKPLLEAAVAESSFHLPAPQNVTIISYNFQNTLKWSPVMGINSSAVSYRVEHCKKSDCVWAEEVDSTNITKPEYYFTNVISEFVEVIFRVRTEQGELKSDWVETAPFQARTQTILGPPREIDATVEANSIFVSYNAPFDNKSRFFVFQYLISYWEKSTDKDLPSSDKVVVDTRDTQYTLANLMEMTEYCFHIQAVLPEKDLHGRLSDTYCKKTSFTETRRILFITLTFIFAVIILIIVFFCLMVIQKHQNVIKSLWGPPLTIPLHYEEDLQNPQMTVVEEFKNCAGEDHWDSVSVLPSAEQNPTVTNSTDGNNQNVHLLETDEFR
ncbi:PREDICTED: interferon gamma receptor 2 [Gekko japonicus]|uniref:Tissue factor n=1 Tax=Gekko japonicus TaxID=146911 RepID=A0ABM1L389_GEKJA|nr:PREDICTED: interferon gamma receptor 2 [Gekko japonicus]